MDLVGLPEIALDVDGMSAEALSATVVALANDRESAAARIRERLPAIQARLQEQYREVLPGPLLLSADASVAQLVRR
jgi:hypothetical protein